MCYWAVFAQGILFMILIIIVKRGTFYHYLKRVIFFPLSSRHELSLTDPSNVCERLRDFIAEESPYFPKLYLQSFFPSEVFFSLQTIF